jgi:hypothetical protein
MEKFTRIISIDGNYAYNTIGETFYVTNDLLPMSTPCVISYNPEWTSSINRIAIDDEGEELIQIEWIRNELSDEQSDGGYYESQFTKVEE